MAVRVSSASIDIDDSIGLHLLAAKVAVPESNLLDWALGLSFLIKEGRGRDRVDGLVQQACGDRILSDIEVPEYFHTHEMLMPPLERWSKI